MIAHLEGREKALAEFGWSEREAEWIALVCLHSGSFVRVQAMRFLDAHREEVRRLVRAVTDQRLAVEERVSGIRGRVCRFHARRLYRALGAEHIRHRRSASREVLLRRLLSLDYVIERTGLPWLPTEREKVAAFEKLGIEKSLLPSRLYRGAAGGARRYFHIKLPVAVDEERAVFVHVDPGHRTTTALRSWGAAHRELWRALRRRGHSIEVVAASRCSGEGAARVLRGWAETAEPITDEEEADRTELARIEQAVLRSRTKALNEYGGLQAALERAVALEERIEGQPKRGLVDRVDTWRSTRLREGLYT